MKPNPVLACIKQRRVTRYFASTPIPDDVLQAILEAGRWAPTGGNRRLHRFVVVTDQPGIELIRLMAPGMLGHPTAIVVICIDWDRVERLGAKRHHKGVYIDVGTAAQNMLLAAEAFGLGAGPVTSFSKSAVGQILGLPDSMQPELAVCLGWKAALQPFDRTLPHTPTRLQDLVIRRKFQSGA